VSEKKADKQRYWIAYLLKDLGEGDNFRPDLLHLTIIPWFVTERYGEEVKSAFREQFSGQKPFKVEVREVIEFKSRRRIPVNLIEPIYNLLSLHEQALHYFSLLNARWAVKNPYVSEEYIPHVRRRSGYNLSQGESLQVDSLSLVSARRRGDDLRTVVAKVSFDE
jgi:2'-5' RNA ligase